MVGGKRSKRVDDEFPIETTTKWILGLGYPEVTIRCEGESSIIAVGRKITEKLEEASVKAMQNNDSSFDSRSAGQAESGVTIVREKVRRLVCYARELHGVTVGRSRASLPWCARVAAQMISR